MNPNTGAKPALKGVLEEGVGMTGLVLCSTNDGAALRLGSKSSGLPNQYRGARLASKSDVRHHWEPAKSLTGAMRGINWLRSVQQSSASRRRERHNLFAIGDGQPAQLRPPLDDV